MTIAFVANVADSFEPLFVYELRDFFDESLFINLIRNLCDDNNFPVLALSLDCRPGAHRDLAATGFICLTDAPSAVNDSGSWKIGSRNIGHDFTKRRLGIVDEVDGGLTDFGHVMRRHVRSHAHSNAPRAIY